jgi:hypothetical protein
VEKTIFAKAKTKIKTVFLGSIFIFLAKNRVDAKIIKREYKKGLRLAILKRYHFVARTEDLTTKTKLSGFVTVRLLASLPGERDIKKRETKTPKKPEIANFNLDFKPSSLRIYKEAITKNIKTKRLSAKASEKPEAIKSKMKPNKDLRLLSRRIRSDKKAFKNTKGIV